MPPISKDGQKSLCQEERAFKVNIEQTVELIFCHRFNRVKKAETGIVDQYIKIRTLPETV